MPATSRIQAVGLVSSLPSGSKNLVTEEYVNTNAPYQTSQLVLSSGATQISIPNPRVKGVLIVFPTVPGNPTDIFGIRAGIFDGSLLLGVPPHWLFLPIPTTTTEFYIAYTPMNPADTYRIELVYI